MKLRRYTLQDRVTRVDHKANEKTPLAYALAQIRVSHGETTFIKEFPREYYSLPRNCFNLAAPKISDILSCFTDSRDRHVKAIAISDRAESIMIRLFGHEAATPHGFYNPNSFNDSRSERTIRNKIRRFIRARLAEKMVARYAV